MKKFTIYCRRDNDYLVTCNSEQSGRYVGELTDPYITDTVAFWDIDINRCLDIEEYFNNCLWVCSFDTIEELKTQYPEYFI